MSDLINRIKQQTSFFWGYALLTVAAALFLITNGKGGSFLIMNGFHRPWLDRFFTWYTNAGDGIFAIVLVLIFFFVLKRRKLAVVLLLAYSSTGILAQVIKALLFSAKAAYLFSSPALFFFYRWSYPWRIQQFSFGPHRYGLYTGYCVRIIQHG
jgi:hypothetical protein